MHGGVCARYHDLWMHYRSSKFLALTGEVSSSAMCWLLWVDESACANTCVIGCWQQQQQQQQQLRRVETLETNNDSPVTHGSSSSGGWGYSGGHEQTEASELYFAGHGRA